MATMKHTDDDGDLSVFAAGDQILFACTGGHFWLVEARQQQIPREAAGGREGLLAEALDGLEGFDSAEVMRAMTVQDDKA